MYINNNFSIQPVIGAPEEHLRSIRAYYETICIKTSAVFVGFV